MPVWVGQCPEWAGTGQGLHANPLDTSCREGGREGAGTIFLLFTKAVICLFAGTVVQLFAGAISRLFARDYSYFSGALFCLFSGAISRLLLGYFLAVF